MPTPQGKPRPGDVILNRAGALVGTVISRTDGAGYSVRARMVDTGSPRWITEFAWWAEHNDWTVAIPPPAAEATARPRMATRRVPGSLIRAITKIRLLQRANSEADAALLNGPLLVLVDALIHPDADLRAREALEELSGADRIEFDALDLACDYYSILGELRRAIEEPYGPRVHKHYPSPRSTRTAGGSP